MNTVIYICIYFMCIEGAMKIVLGCMHQDKLLIGEGITKIFLALLTVYLIDFVDEFYQRREQKKK